MRLTMFCLFSRTFTRQRYLGVYYGVTFIHSSVIIQDSQPHLECCNYFKLNINVCLFSVTYIDGDRRRVSTDGFRSSSGVNGSFHVFVLYSARDSLPLSVIRVDG